MTKNIMLFTSNGNDRVEYILDILKDDYGVVIINDCDKAIEKLTNNFEEYVGLIIDNPSSKDKCTKRLINCVADLNSFMFGIPIIILSDKENENKDEEYISDKVVAIIKKGESKKVVIQRIKSCIMFSNSTNFQEFSKMLKQLPSLIYLKDNKGRYIFCSQYWHHLANKDDPTWTIRGKTDLEVRLNKQNAQKAYDNDMEVINTGIGKSYVIQENKINNLGNDEKEYMQIVKEPIRNEKTGEVMGIIAIVSDVTKEETMRRELRKSSITDPLTEAYNRVYLEEFIKYHLAEDVFPLSIISADCDGLKMINDQFGHQAGDKYITMAYTLLKEVLPDESVIFRMGGDEFLAVLPKMKNKDARVYLELLNKGVSRFYTDDFDLSVSVGLYTMNDKTDSIDRCMAMSDKAMYEAKRKKSS